MVRASASASLSVDVEVVAVTGTEVTAREVIEDVMLVVRARKVHHLESSLLNCKFTVVMNYALIQEANILSAVVDLDVAVVELLLLLKSFGISFCLLVCIRQKYLIYF